MLPVERAADFGFVGWAAPPDGQSRLEYWRSVLESLPPEFSTVWVADHFQFGESPRAEAWTLVSYLAALFPRFKFGHLVLGQSFRNPALLAKMAATLQELTGGRYILGIGAGWHEEEYSAYGYDYPSGGVRVQQLAEAIEIMRAMWTSSPATFHGEYYRIDGAYCEPKPDPPIPIMVGTNGPKALRVVARLADMWNWDAPWDDVYQPPYERLRGYCQEIGRPFEDIGLTAMSIVSLPDRPEDFEATFTHSFYPGQTFRILGPTPADVTREIELLVDAGVTHFQVMVEDMPTLDRFVEDVIPAVRLERKSR
jgi:alkanesulfonate monooxygenase SsuD/methylene tetrahydromethanopterin reductase-like flavin-dependent oxidoreductase (luciferase family)